MIIVRRKKFNFLLKISAVFCVFTFFTGFLMAQEAPPKSASSQAANALLGGDPLAWLDLPMECDHLVEQVQARYLPLGPYAQFPHEKKKEVAKVIDVVCSERFSHCRFVNCLRSRDRAASLENAGVDGTGFSIDDMLYRKPSKKNGAGSQVRVPRGKAERELEKDFRAYRNVQKKLIAEAVANERKNKLSWQRFSIK